VDGKRDSGLIWKAQACKLGIYHFSEQRWEEMWLTLNIAKMVQARQWLFGGVLIVGLVTWIEALLTIASAFELGARTLVFQAIALALLIAQFRILGVTRSAFARVSRDLWRAYAFISLAFVFFILAGGVFRDPVLPLYFALLSVILAYPSLNAIRGLIAIGKDLQAVPDPTFLNCWLFGGRPTLSKLVVGHGRLPRAVPWFVLGACSIFSLIALIVLHELEIVRFGVPVALFLLIGAYCLNRGRRHIKVRAAELRQLDRRAPVLILRSFRDDKLSIERRVYRRTFRLRPTLEEMVAYEADSLGPSIAIGEPGEKLPPLGASREYLRNEEWRTAVSKLIDEAALIIFILGDTDNLFWEFSTAIGKRGKDALLVIVPPLRKTDLEIRWRRFAAANAAFLGTTFLQNLPNESVVAFFFRQDDPVLVVSQKRGRWDYALGIRLFIGLYQTKLSSVRDVKGHLSAHAPAVLARMGQGFPKYSVA
jgi:hypothetical protein